MDLPWRDAKLTLKLQQRGPDSMPQMHKRFLSSHVLRAALAMVVGVGLAACGFTPMYATSDSPQAVAVTGTMAAIQIHPIADHDGMMLRQNLREGLQPEGPAARFLYDLDVQMRSTTQNIGIRPDATASRANLIYTAHFALSQNGKRVMADQVQTIVSYDIADDQYATVAAANDASTQAIKQIGDEIKIRIGLYLQSHKNQLAASP